MLSSVHESFKDVVRSARKDRLKGNEEELFSGRAWTGRQVQLSRSKICCATSSPSP